MSSEERFRDSEYPQIRQQNIADAVIQPGCRFKAIYIARAQICIAYITYWISTHIAHTCSTLPIVFFLHYMTQMASRANNCINSTLILQEFSNQGRCYCLHFPIDIGIYICICSCYVSTDTSCWNASSFDTFTAIHTIWITTCRHCNWPRMNTHIALTVFI